MHTNRLCMRKTVPFSKTQMLGLVTGSQDNLQECDLVGNSVYRAPGTPIFWIVTVNFVCRNAVKPWLFSLQ